MNRINIDQVEFTDDYLYTCQGLPFTGVGYELDDVGRLRCEITFVNGIRDGVSKTWNEDGMLTEQSHFKHNALHGPVNEWSSTGRREAIYELGICVEDREWNKDGVLVNEFKLSEDDPQYVLLSQLRSARFC